MGLKEDFTAAQAAIHHSNGRVELGKPFAFGAQPGQPLDATPDPAAVPAPDHSL